VRNFVIKIKLSKKLEGTMSENGKDENDSIIPDVNIKKSRSTHKFQKNMEQNNNSFDIKDITKEEWQRSKGDQQKIDELKELLEKEKEKSLRLQADYQNLEKQTIDRINTSGDKIILDFLTVYEDFIRAKDAYEKEGGNVDNLNGIIKNMETILGNYDVKPIETEGKKFDPKLHEVIQELEDNDHEEGTIVKEIAKGYIIRNEVMKYSKVCVSKKIIKE
jgi:molecular chaperone GrpE